MSKRRVFGVIVGVIGMFLGVMGARSALAGYKSDGPLSIGSTYFYGAFGTVRNTGNASQYMYCYVYATATPYVSASCYATNGAGASASCSTTNATVVDAIQKLNSDAYVTVYFNSSGTCTGISSQNTSWAPPKVL
jgi:hypothetical protein